MNKSENTMLGLKLVVRSVSFVLLLTTQISFANMLPAWVVSPKADSPTHLYGIGAGETILEAREAAALDIASKIEVVVSSQVSVHHSLVNDEFSSRTSVNTASQTNALPVGQLRLDISAQIGKTVWARYEIARQDYLNFQLPLAENESAEIERLWSLFQTTSELRKVSIAKKIEAKVKVAFRRLTALNGIAYHDSSQRLARFNDILDQLSDKASKPTFFIISEYNNGDVEVAKAISIELEKQGLDSRIVNKPPSSPSVRVLIQRESVSTKRDDAFETRINVDVVLIDSDNSVYASKVFYGSARSYQSEKESEKRAIQSIKMALKRKGLDLL